MTNQYLWDRISGRDLLIRAADADRERVAERLRKSHAEGRLDMAEFQQRLERCYEAKTLGELSELVRDLPRQAEPAERPTGWLPHLRLRLVPLVPVLIVLVLISALSGHEHDVFWLWVAFLFVFWRLFRHRRRWWTPPRRQPGDWI
jgi:hypothetical protein